MAVTPPEKLAERQAIAARCSRHLAEHGPEWPRSVLDVLAATIYPDEMRDLYGSGAMVRELEEEIAETLGKPAAMFVPTGTMAQQIALRIWSERNGSRNVAFHPTCHLETHEQKAYERLHGLHGITVGDGHRLIRLDDLQKIDEPLAALLLELPQREIGSQLPDWSDLQQQIAWAHERGAAVHMDGARLWECAPFYGRSYVEIAAPFDSVYVSFYKTLGALAGAVLAGPEDFIAEARVWRRRHGGDLFQFYPYVASARACFRERIGRIGAYCERARSLAALFSELPEVEVKPNPPHTNMMHVYLRGDGEELVERSMALAREEDLLLIRWLAPSEIPGWCMWELTIGDGALSISDEAVRAGLMRVLHGE